MINQTLLVKDSDSTGPGESETEGEVQGSTVGCTEAGEMRPGPCQQRLESSTGNPVNSGQHVAVLTWQADLDFDRGCL